MSGFTAPTPRHLHKTETVSVQCPWCPSKIEFEVVTKIVNNWPAGRAARSTMASRKSSTQHHECPGPKEMGS